MDKSRSSLLQIILLIVIATALVASIVYLVVYLKNETSKPAKIITILSMRNGMKVPDKDQYPVSYRTKRLYKNETESFGNYWEPGDDLIIQVHEGKMHIEVAKEKR